MKKFDDLMKKIEKHELKVIEEVLMVFDYLQPIEWTPKYMEKMVDTEYARASIKQFVVIKKKFCCCYRMIKKKGDGFRKMISDGSGKILRRKRMARIWGKSR